MSRTSVNRSAVDVPAVPSPVLEALHRLRAPIMVAHVVPDADAIGAAFAMTLAWSVDECRPAVALPDGSLSQRLAFLLDWAKVPVAAEEDFSAADGFVVLDTAKQDRCNVGKSRKQTDWIAGRPIINIDHHATNTNFGDVNWVVSTAGSTCELVHALLRAADRPITPLIASLLYAGIQTDTLGFSLPTTSANALSAAADLLACGADVAQIGELLCRSQRKSEFDLLRVVYANTRLVADGRIAYSSASHEEIHAAGCTAADIDDQINVPRSLDGVQLAMLFTEGKKGRTRINFRSSDSVTVVELAGEFNGGGHAQAAGAILDCGLQDAIDKVVPRAMDYLKRFPAP